MSATPVPAPQYKEKLYKDKHGHPYFTLVNCPCCKLRSRLLWPARLTEYPKGMFKFECGGCRQITPSTDLDTLNRELALLRRAFSLGFDVEPQKVSRVPKFYKHIVSEKGNERRGFVEETECRKLVEEAREPWLRGLLALAYTFGFRKSELLEMRCSQVDLLNDTVSLYNGETKNGEGRIVVLTEECRLLLTELRKGKQPEDFLFTRSGEPVRDFRGT